MRDWLIRHPEAVGLLFVVLAARAAWTAFECGRLIGAERALLADADRLASEALGG